VYRIKKLKERARPNEGLGIHNNNNNNNNKIQFIYVQNLTAQRPITKLAQARK
jgi:hypothetical protein